MFGGIEMAVHKCKRCVWSDEIDSDLLYCILPKCIMKEEITEQTITTKKTAVASKARIDYENKLKRRNKHVSKKTTKALQVS